MKKRYTDADKWDKKWFRKLSKEAKLLWLYILDTCDYAGIWEEDLERIQFAIGIPDYESAFKEVSCQLYKIKGDKYLVIDFIKFQYGSLDERNPVHRKVISILEKHNIVDYVNIENLPRHSEEELVGSPHPTRRRPTRGSQEEEKEEEKEKEKDIVKRLSDLSEILERIPDELKNIEGFEDVWAEWETFRKQKRNKLTDISRKAQWNFLISQPDPIECIRQSIRQGWVGLFEVKNKNQKQSKIGIISDFIEGDENESI